MNREMVKQAYDEICGLEKEAVTVDGNKIFLDKEDYEVLPYTVKDRMKDLAKSPAGKALAGVGLTAAGVGGATYGINKYKAMKRRRAEQEQADKVAAAYDEICGFEKEAEFSQPQRVTYSDKTVDQENEDVERRLAERDKPIRKLQRRFGIGAAAADGAVTGAALAAGITKVRNMMKTDAFEDAQDSVRQKAYRKAWDAESEKMFKDFRLGKDVMGRSVDDVADDAARKAVAKAVATGKIKQPKLGKVVPRALLGAGIGAAALGGAAYGISRLNHKMDKYVSKKNKEEAAEKAAAYYDEAQYAKEAALSDYDEACAYEAAALEVLDELGYLD